MVSSKELSPSTLESRLSGIPSVPRYHMGRTWDAIILIDKADLERNALVSVALEYHRELLFLTTNRIQPFDEPFLSRFSIAIKYPEFNVSAGLTIWHKFFELARCYVSLSDLEALAQKPFNDQCTRRTIKKLARAGILDVSFIVHRKEPLSLDHVKVVVRAQEKF
ncbi:hypothetical protein K503DRAFT_789619 [Rhizopogon vinicolor AM-OR11-026]|uniref:Uncharacterized protein n=1 Tax=Rhizopogon vinicolor AM-OR11-026 TaxID=1314800 RepID=A0A1B7NEL5_9AGAM|nr:hypothetical protein K503DRAFT_789619 [Rhizopogon vinicolor AM-OR11-026]